MSIRKFGFLDVKFQLDFKETDLEEFKKSIMDEIIKAGINIDEVE